MSYMTLFTGAFLGDLLCKKYAEEKLPEHTKLPVLGGKIILQKYHNKGAACGILADRPDFLKNGTLGMLAGIVVHALLGRKKHTAVEKTGTALMLAGGFCNWFDRFHQGYVTDYFSINCGWKKLREVVFNLSDFFILTGAVLMTVGGLAGGKKHSPEKTSKAAKQR